MVILDGMMRSPVSIKGSLVCDRKTKELVKRIEPGQIAVICHDDIDEVAARGLIQKKVKAIVNFGCTMTGRYPTPGPGLLLSAGIAVFDITGERPFGLLADGMELSVKGKHVYVSDKAGSEIHVGTVKRITDSVIQAKLAEAKRNLDRQLKAFVDNTLVYALKEKDDFLKPFPMPDIRTRMTGKHVLVVVRGSHYKEDLNAIRSYIDDYKPVLIGVDPGGADALLENGLQPDVIIGDMDSVSDRALRQCRDIIVHAYPSGESPGKKRLAALNIPFQTLPFPGTSEDVAMLLAYEKDPELIVSLGTHSNMVDFLEKGRKGMASTLLARMKIGNRLVDAKGVSMLYPGQIKVKNFVYMGLAACVPLFALGMVSSNVRELLRILWLQMKLFL